MNQDWYSIRYLQTGSPDQQKAFQVLSELRLLEILASYHPVLTGTFPLNIPVKGSDLDICCECYSFSSLLADAYLAFGMQEGYTTEEKSIAGNPSLLVRFSYKDLLIEIFAQPHPVEKQNAFRHMLAEHALLQQYGEPLRKQVIELKKKGFKTEPAFAKALDLEGDPYKCLLNFCP